MTTVAALLALVVAADSPTLAAAEQHGLPDFSYAGYQRGEAPLPQREPTVSVLDFGATPDDDTDDTAAFRKAIAEHGGACIGVPAGRFLLSDTLTIDVSGTVLQGKGSGETVLHFTRSLEEVQPNLGATTGGRPTSNWSWSGGMIRLQGGNERRVTSTRVTAESPQDATVLHLPADIFAVGDELLVEARANDDAVARAVYGDLRPDDTDVKNVRVRQVVRVTAVEGERHTIDRRLRLQADPTFTTVRPFEPTLVESGVEGLTLSFPRTPYEGHFTEVGYNGIAVAGNAAHCWIRDVRLVDCDSGIFVAGTFITLDGVTLESAREPDKQGNVGHHALSATGSDCLITNFFVGHTYVHDTTVSGGSTGNVWSNGGGVDLALDHHRWGPYQNLFSNLDMGRGTRYFKSGGGGERGRHCGRGGTFWNLRGERPATMPDANFGPSGLFFIGVHGLTPDAAPDGWHVAELRDDDPAELHAAQRAARLEREESR